MLLAFVLAASLVDWVPARWISNDPKSLDLLSGTPINCVLLEKPLWSEAFAQEAAKRGVATLGVIHPDMDPLDAGRQAKALQLAGVVAEGAFDQASAQRARKALADSNIRMIEMTTRSRMRFDSGDPVIGTFQGLWPGVRIEEGEGAHAGPSGAPWINTNTGFLRFARAATDSTVWIGYQPPPKTVVTLARYVQAIGDAAMTGARWVVSLDEEFSKRLLSRDPAALKEWAEIGQYLKFFEAHKEWRSLRAHSDLTLVEDAESGALLSGGILDMIAVKHTPVRPVPYAKIGPPAFERAKMAVEVDPSALTDAQKAVVRAFARSGGTLLTGPPNWKFQSVQGDTITLDKNDLAKLDDIWKEVNSLTGRQNLGVRLFNVSSMLSSLLETADRKQLVLQLVNYTEYPVENITAHVLGQYKKATLYLPDGSTQKLDTYPVDEGTGVDIDKMGWAAAIVLE